MNGSSPVLGCIADDFTGATDLGNTFVQEGIRTVVVIGTPSRDLDEPADAIVVSLKSRTLPVATAVEQSLQALKWLQLQGCTRFYFKYCSTFDSTDSGNIGPVIDALMVALDCPITIVCPAFPEAGRTVFRGHLFVGDHPLNESGMQNHPLTPMRDANLIRVLRPQTRAEVVLLRYDVIAEGYEASRIALHNIRSQRVQIVIADAISDSDLRVLGQVALRFGLATGASGLGRGFAQALRGAGYLTATGTAAELPAIPEGAAILAGSCSQATLRQVAHWRATRPAFHVDPTKLAASAAGQAEVVGEALAFAEAHRDLDVVLFFASAEASDVRAVQASLGVRTASELIETALGNIARGLHASGIRRFVVAGGDTSGAIVQALDVRTLRIGAQIDPGVPWTASSGNDPVALALKSGNFGALDFFSKALAQFEGAAHA